MLTGLMRVLIRIFILVIAFGTIVSCAPAGSAPVTLTISGTGEGTVNVNGNDHPLPLTATFEIGSTVTLLAQPANGYAFSSWSGDVVSAANPVAVSITSNTNLTATFTRTPAILVAPEARSFGAVQVGEVAESSFTVTNMGGGTLIGTVTTEAPFEIIEGASYHLERDVSQRVVVRFTPSAENRVSGLVTFTGGAGVEAAVTGTGTLAPPTRWNLDVVANGRGTVTSSPAGIDCPSDCFAPFSDGSDVVLLASPITGAPNPTWSGCDTPSRPDAPSASCILAMNSHRTVSVSFPEPPEVAETPEISVNIIPTSVTLFTSANQALTATLTGTTGTRLVWQTTGGNITGTGLTVTYTAPTTAGSYTVTATSVADNNSSASVDVIVDPRVVTRLAAGANHSLALKNDGTVWAWGSNTYGQHGDGTNQDRWTPIQVPTLFDIVAIAAGDEHSLAVRSDGSLWAWGNNAYGQLATPLGLVALEPTTTDMIRNVIGVAAGSNHSMALTADGRVWAWGANGTGQLGDGTIDDNRYPRAVPNLTNIQAIAASGRYSTGHSLAADTEGNVYAWGENTYGEGGSREDDDCGYYYPCLRSPRRVSVSATRSLSTGYRFSLATTQSGATYAWGGNWFGQLDAESSEWCHAAPGATRPNACSHDPLRIQPLPSIQQIAAGFEHAAAITTSGDLYVWGVNTRSQLGVASSELCEEYRDTSADTPCSTTPIHLPTLSGVAYVAAGGDHTLALLTNNTVWAWGANGSGELGDGSNVTRPTPVMIDLP